jgi:hypothetical protein
LCNRQSLAQLLPRIRANLLRAFAFLANCIGVAIACGLVTGYLVIVSAKQALQAQDVVALDHDRA